MKPIGHHSFRNAGLNTTYRERAELRRLDESAAELEATLLEQAKLVGLEFTQEVQIATEEFRGEAFVDYDDGDTPKTSGVSKELIRDIAVIIASNQLNNPTVEPYSSDVALEILRCIATQSDIDSDTYSKLFELLKKLFDEKVIAEAIGKFIASEALIFFGTTTKQAE